MVEEDHLGVAFSVALATLEDGIDNYRFSLSPPPPSLPPPLLEAVSALPHSSGGPCKQRVFTNSDPEQILPMFRANSSKDIII